MNSRVTSFKGGKTTAYGSENKNTNHKYALLIISFYIQYYNFDFTARYNSLKAYINKNNICENMSYIHNISLLKLNILSGSFLIYINFNMVYSIYQHVSKSFPIIFNI